MLVPCAGNLTLPVERLDTQLRILFQDSTPRKEQTNQEHDRFRHYIKTTEQAVNAETEISNSRVVTIMWTSKHPLRLRFASLYRISTVSDDKHASDVIEKQIKYCWPP